jgi:aspartate kinase
LEPERQREVADAIERHGEAIHDYIRGVVLLRELTPRIQDTIVGYGEKLSSLLFTARAQREGLDAVLVDAREFMVTDDHFTEARPNQPLLEKKAKSKLGTILADEQIPVTQGFVGQTEDGTPTTLGRGGSDYTAALLGAALDAEEIQVWTDVDGMLTADSRIVGEGMKVRELSFAEAAELAYFGAKVLHPATIEPAMSRDIPVRILNSRYPNSSGTRITASKARSKGPVAAVKSIAAKKGITTIHVQSLRMLMAHGFLRSMFEVFDRHEVSVDLVSTSEVSVSLTVDRQDQLRVVVEELSQFSKVAVKPDCAIICLVGEGIQSTPGIAARVFKALGDINVSMISQGSSEINLSVVVHEDQADEAVRRLHREFFSDVQLPDLFESIEREASQ